VQAFLKNTKNVDDYRINPFNRDRNKNAEILPGYEADGKEEDGS
jgi:hypothetical protein